MKQWIIVAVLLNVVILGAIAVAQQPAPALDPGLKKVVQVAILTRDVQASAKRWAAVLGVEPGPMRLTKPGADVKLLYRGKPSGGQARIINFRTEGATLEIMEPVGGDTSWKEILDQKGEIVHHIAFNVQDVPGTVKHFQSLGYPVAHKGLYDGLNGSYTYMDTEKSLGVIIELLHADTAPGKK